MSEPDDTVLRRASRRAEVRVAFLAGALAQYRAMHAADDAALAAFLGCEPRRLPLLAFCRRPDPSTPSFHSDVRRIAVYVGASELQLVNLLREVEALAALRTIPQQAAGGGESGFLMAARDRAGEGPVPVDESARGEPVGDGSDDRDT